jgi:hypothetical protein
VGVVVDSKYSKYSVGIVVDMWRNKKLEEWSSWQKIHKCWPWNRN